MKISRLACLLLLVLALSCADSGGPVVADAEWSLSCPSSGGADCGSWAVDSCIGAGNQRAIVGEHGQPECDDRIIAICEAVERSDGTRNVRLEANVGNRFAFELRGATVDDGSGLVEQTACNVTIIEDEVPYDVGACGKEPPTMEQPCQLSNFSTEGNQVVFDLKCESLFSSVTSLALDVQSPTPIRFANCTGF
jgi:hypothetical protein